jgi:hypothetical protein
LSFTDRQPEADSVHKCFSTPLTFCLNWGTCTYRRVSRCMAFR